MSRAEKQLALLVAIAVIAVLLLLLMAGCAQQVRLSPAFMRDLETQTARSEVDARWAEAGRMTPAAMTMSLRESADAWRLLWNAANGVKATTRPATQPAGAKP